MNETMSGMEYGCLEWQWESVAARRGKRFGGCDCTDAVRTTKKITKPKKTLSS